MSTFAFLEMLSSTHFFACSGFEFVYGSVAIKPKNGFESLSVLLFVKFV